ncbi:hypothetical protein DIPPA_27109, partial [Diplonema papillatum]
SVGRDLIVAGEEDGRREVAWCAATEEPKGLDPGGSCRRPGCGEGAGEEVSVVELMATCDFLVTRETIRQRMLSKQHDGSARLLLEGEAAAREALSHAEQRGHGKLTLRVLTFTTAVELLLSDEAEGNPALPAHSVAELLFSETVHLCWLLSLWEEKVTRTWLKREGVLVEEESSDGEEDTDGEAADGEAAAEYAVAKGAQGHETEAHLKTLGIVLGAIGETETAFDADEALRKVAVLRRLEVVRIGQTAGWQEAEAAATAWEEDEAPDFLKKGLAAAEKMRRKKEKAKQGGNAFQKAKSSRGGEGRK